MRLPVPISGVSAHQGAFVELTAKDTIVLADFVNTTGELGFDGTLSRRQPFSCIALDRFADVQSRLLAKGGTCPKCSRVEGCSAWSGMFRMVPLFFVQSETPKSAPKPDRLGCRSPRHVDVRNFGGPKHPPCACPCQYRGFRHTKGPLLNSRPRTRLSSPIL